MDGFTFDAEGNLWVTTVVRNGFGVLTRDGDWHVVVEDPARTSWPPSPTSWPRAARARGHAGRGQAAAAVPDRLCFAGPDRRTVYVGSLAMSRLPAALPSLVCRCATGTEHPQHSGAARTELKNLGMRRVASGASSTTVGRIVAGGGEERRDLIILPE